MIRYMIFVVLQLKDCIGLGGFMGYLCLSDVLSTKHVVNNLGHMRHPLQHFFTGFLKFCKTSWNILCGYSWGSFVWFILCCVFDVVSCSVSSIGSNFALTSLFFREGLPLNAIIGVFGNMFLNVSNLCISFQCFLIICLSLFASSLNCVMNTSFRS